MRNERITEGIVREQLRKAGYFKETYNDTSDIEIYEQKTSDRILENLLDKASRNNNGIGISEYILPVKGYDIIDYKCITFGAQGNVGVANSFYQANPFIPRQLYGYWNLNSKLIIIMAHFWQQC